MSRLVPIIIVVLLGCSGETTSGGLADHAELTGGVWVAADLVDGSVMPVAAPGDPAQWRGRRVLFRQIAPGQAVVGRAVADVVVEADERPLRTVAHGRLWIAVFELTQAQWRLLSDTRPWLAALPLADLEPYVGDDLPASGLSPALAITALGGWPGRDGWRLDLPDADEWEIACLAGGRDKFAWGDSLDPTAAATHAVLGQAAPQPVGSRLPNAWGLYDVHGNAWELTSTSVGWQARGGGWDQPVITARTSNRLDLPDAATVGWNLGLRPVLRR